MDWNLEQNKQQKMADRVLDLLEEAREGRDITRSIAKAHALDLQEGLQVRKCVTGQSTTPVRNRNSVYKPTNAGRNKWFDAK